MQISKKKNDYKKRLKAQIVLCFLFCFFITWFKFSALRFTYRFWYLNWILSYLLIIFSFSLIIIIIKLLEISKRKNYKFFKIVAYSIEILSLLGLTSILMISLFLHLVPPIDQTYESIRDPNAKNCYIVRRKGWDFGAMSEEVNYLNYECYIGNLFIYRRSKYNALRTNIISWIEDKKCFERTCKLYMLNDISLAENGKTIEVKVAEYFAEFDLKTGELLEEETLEQPE